MLVSGKISNPAGYERTIQVMNNELTRKDIEEMQAEIDRRKLVERPKLLEEVKETRAQGTSARTSNITWPREPKIRMRAGSAFSRE